MAVRRIIVLEDDLDASTADETGRSPWTETQMRLTSARPKPRNFVQFFTRTPTPHARFLLAGSCPRIPTPRRWLFGAFGTP
jgi:hypothetical protein